MTISPDVNPDHELSELLTLNLSNSVEMDFRLVPAGSFRMGSRGRLPREEPRHTVRITEPFYMGIYPVTKEQFAIWKRAAKVKHQNTVRGTPVDPVEHVDWHQASQYCEWLTEVLATQLPIGYCATLPTEAQWEYACRAGTTTDYYSGDGVAALHDVGWYENNCEEECGVTTGILDPNAFGLYDMHGNVWEWCRDVFEEDAYKSRVDGISDPYVARDPSVIDPLSTRVIRGGSCEYGALECRSAFRGTYGPSERDVDVGFRVCLASVSLIKQA